MTYDAPPARTSLYRHRVRYFEADQQGVVFNMWYLGYFDEAMTQFLEEGGLPYSRMLDEGFDIQLVHTEIDWRSSLRWPDRADVTVEVEGTARTSFKVRFDVRNAAGEDVATGRTVYVAVAADGSGKRPIPPILSGALGLPSPPPGSGAAGPAPAAGPTGELGG